MKNISLKIIINIVAFYLFIAQVSAQTEHPLVLPYDVS